MDKEARSWLGRHESELVQAWGEPTHTEPDGHGGVVLIYEHLIGAGDGDDSSGGCRFERRFEHVTERTSERGDGNLLRRFLVNRAGVIYAWEWRDA